MIFSKIFENLDFFKTFQLKIVLKKSRFSKNFDIFEKSRFSRKIFRFFHFLRWIFYGFQKILMFWKVEVQLFPKSIMSIYEICSTYEIHRNGPNVTIMRYEMSPLKKTLLHCVIHDGQE